MANILLADDDTLTLQMLQATLEDEHQVTAIADSAAALDLALTHPFDLVLLDVDMPGMSGYECCERIKASPQGALLPVMFLSALTGLDERLRGYSAGGEDYLTKPFDAEELLAKVRRVLQHHGRERELTQQLDEVMNAALASADMVGETGVVLDFQRAASACATPEALALALLDAVQRFGFDACVRLRGLRATESRNLRGPASALESSLLDHLQTADASQRMHAVGPHAGFHWGKVLLFVRGLPLANLPDDREAAERIGRVRDNIALLMEGALQRLAAIDSAQAVRDLDTLSRLVQMTHQALADIAARSQAQQLAVAGLCETLNERLEYSFLQLGLTSVQEDHLVDLIQGHRRAVLAELAQGQALDSRLREISSQLRAQLQP